MLGGASGRALPGFAAGAGHPLPSPPNSPASPPESLSPVTITASTVSLTWGAPAQPVTSYNVYVNGSRAAGGGGGTSATVAGLAPSTLYTFAVTAVTGNAESPQSLPVYVTTSASGTLATPYAVTHGKYLTINNVGPWALQGVARGSETLQSVTITSSNNRVTTFPGNTIPPAWVPSGSYTYNNSPSNHGGTLAAATVIDGYTVPAGTWVAQFLDFSDSLVVEGDCSGASPAWPGILFRGCRMRRQWIAPGFADDNGSLQTGGITWFNFCDGGGIYEYYQQNGSATTATEVVYQQYNSQKVLNRCYVSGAVTFLGIDWAGTTGDAVIECFIENQTAWYNPSGPDAGFYHYNVISAAGGQVAHLLLRNNAAISPQPAAQPWYFVGTVNIQYAADDGAYFGTGTNIDGSTGFQIRDNFLGGTQFVHSFGVDKGNTSADVTGVTCTGNQYTTYYFESFGQAGIAYKVCPWGIQSNTWSGNTYADDYGSGSWPTVRGDISGSGPLAGTSISAPT